MKHSANERLHCTDYDMVCDNNFFGCFTPGRSPQSLNYDVMKRRSSDFHLRRTVGVKVVEKFSVTYHIVISANVSFRLFALSFMQFSVKIFSL